ncbi:hypothetical protein BJX65DRAFT_223861 [Aspergillus insuetus]
MWPRKRSQKTGVPNSDSRDSHHFQWRRLFGRPEAHKHGEDTAQVTKLVVEHDHREATVEAYSERTAADNDSKGNLLQTEQPTCVNKPGTHDSLQISATKAQSGGHSASIAANTPFTTRTDAHVVKESESAKRTPRNLWQEAVAQLTTEQKTILGMVHAPGSPPPSAVESIKTVVQDTKKNLTTYQSRGKIKHRDGTVAFDVRANAQKILRGALRVKDIIDAGVKFDPTGYGMLTVSPRSHTIYVRLTVFALASSAWGVISLGLQLVQNDVDRIDAVFSASALLTDTLSRYANIEANYRDPTFEATRDMEDKIVLVYKAILEFSAEVRQQHSASVGARILQTFYALDEQPLQKLQNSIKSAESDMNNWRVLVENQYRKQEAEQIENTVNDVIGKLVDASADLSMLKTAEEEKQFKEKINWLPTMSTASKHLALVKDRDPGTAEWIFADEQYRAWLGASNGGSSSVMWLHGPYGCGKSVLFAHVVNRLLKQEKGGSGTVCAFWYFDSGISGNNTSAALRSIIAQLAGALRTVPEALEKLRQSNEIPNRAPSIEELQVALLAVAREFRGSSQHGLSEIFIAFDALDECPNRADLLESLEFLANTNCGARFLVTSRPEEDIRAKLGFFCNGSRVNPRQGAG